MTTEIKPSKSPKFPLRLMPSIRLNAEAFSLQEGISLNQFINIAVAEKLAHLQHESWVRRRKEPSPALMEAAGRVLDKVAEHTILPEDTLPEGYRSPVKQKASGKPT